MYRSLILAPEPSLSAGAWISQEYWTYLPVDCRGLRRLQPLGALSAGS